MSKSISDILRSDSAHTDDPNIVFLSSSLNNLMVCAILQGINIDLKNLRINPTQMQSSCRDEVKTTKFY